MAELKPPFRQPVVLRWADIDANFHLRHSVYYDLCAQQRMDVLAEVGLTMADMQRERFGPILFREECVFRREIKLGDPVFLEVAIHHLSRDHRKFGFVHRFVSADEDLLATLTVEGAWMDAVKRKLTVPPDAAVQAVDRLPHSPDFSWLD
ncbi:MAG TPA: acyl-CoA thioesterase [Flavobacteriales bacterium]|nr:thioesterase family protein [Flavobacteriales bacterium]MCB9180507.1 thioesterase family protein [Flavobacteriales bacterium]MCB9198884.1 thioesterase family protein [Flavobacteriales bacterium]HOP45080.1 acyl-CoA thioesterase [Flavobacteriales bacterium]HPJ54263.1 acyl-CoA thioesterase [Flavobacteriales bacterium]